MAGREPGGENHVQGVRHDRGPLMLAVGWEIDDRPQDVARTFNPPCIQMDRGADRARALEVFEERDAVREAMEPGNG